MTSPGFRRFLAWGFLATAAGIAMAAEDDAPAWAESEVALPTFPQQADLVEFFVSAATSNRFFIDAKTLSAGSDGVIRYSLVVNTAGGSTNVSYEGIRCSTREFKLYATGRSDRSWSGLRAGEWRPIENKAMNRHHAVLSRDFFCPGGVAIFKSDEGRDALRRGRHPQAD